MHSATWPTNMPSSWRLATTWLCGHLLAQHFLHHSQIVRLAIDYPLQILDVLAQLFDFAAIKCEGVCGRLLHVEPCADIYKYVLGIRELSRNV